MATLEQNSFDQGLHSEQLRGRTQQVFFSSEEEEKEEESEEESSDEEESENPDEKRGRELQKILLAKQKARQL